MTKTDAYELLKEHLADMQHDIQHRSGYRLWGVLGQSLVADLQVALSKLKPAEEK